MKRILFLGQKPLGKECFDLLAQLPGGIAEVVGISTNPEPTGWWNSADLWAIAKERGILSVSNEDRNEEDLISLIEEQGVNVILSVQHNWILSEKLLSRVKGEAWNLHLAKLPEYGGHHAFSHAILNGDESFSVTLHRMTSEVDSGEIAFSRSFPIMDGATARSLYEAACEEGRKAFSDLLKSWRHGESVRTEMMHGNSRFYSKHSLDPLREISDLSDADEVSRKARAFHFPPYPPAFLRIGEAKYLIVPDETELK